MTDLVLLAAGLGRRIAPVYGNRPKVVMPLPSGRTLLRENVVNASASGVISTLWVVTGYQADVVEADLALERVPCAVKTIYNEAFATAGPIGSLWAAHHLLAERDVLIANGDTYYRPEAFQSLAEQGDGFALACSRRESSDDDVKVRLDRDGTIAEVGKAIDGSPDAVSAGLFLTRGDPARANFAGLVEAAMRERDGLHPRLIWHALVNRLAHQGSPVRPVDIPRAWWHEVDTQADYADLCALLA